MATQTVSTTRALDERHDGPYEACDSESMFEDIDFQHELNERCRIKGMFFFPSDLDLTRTSLGYIFKVEGLPG